MTLTYVGISGIIILVIGIILTLIGFYYLYKQSNTVPTTGTTSSISAWTIALIVFGVLGIILGAVLLYTGRSSDSLTSLGPYVSL